MRRLTESAAERLIAEHSFECGPPGFVGAAIDLPGPAGPGPKFGTGPGSLEGGESPAAEVRRTLRHGFSAVRADGSVTVSGPPSPGLESCVARMTDDLATLPQLAPGGELAAGARVGPDGSGAAGTRIGPDGSGAAGTRIGLDGGGAAGIRVGLEAGLDGGGPLGLARRWRLAHTLAPVLAAAFANSPSTDGPRDDWRSLRAAEHRDRPVLPGAPTADVGPANPALTGSDPIGAAPASSHRAANKPAPISPCVADLGAVDPRWTFAEPGGFDPRASWVAYAMGEPAGGGRSFREWTRSDTPPSEDDLLRHLDGLRAPVAARGHLELDFADGQAGDGWRVVVAVTAVLLDDPVAATAAEAATGHFAYGERVWERAARDALTDEELATAARHCFLAAYAALARRGAPRDLRDAVAAFMERYVMRGRCPADDRLAAARPRVIETS